MSLGPDNTACLNELKTALRDGGVDKRYLAIVATSGQSSRAASVAAAGQLPDKGTIELPIAPHPKDKRRVFERAPRVPTRAVCGRAAGDFRAPRPARGEPARRHRGVGRRAQGAVRCAQRRATEAHCASLGRVAHKRLRRRRVRAALNIKARLAG